MIRNDLKTVNIDGREYLTVKQYADECGMTTSNVYQKIKRDKNGTGFRQYHYTDDDGTQYIDVRALNEITPRTNKELTRLVSDRDEQIARLDDELTTERDRYDELKKTFDNQTVLMNQVFDELKTDNARKQEQIENLTNQVDSMTKQMETMNQTIRDKDTLIENLTNKIADATDKLDKRLAESHSIQLANATANNPGLLHRLFKKKSADFDVM